MTLLKDLSRARISKENHCGNEGSCRVCSEFGVCEVRKNNHRYDKYSDKIIVVDTIVCDLNLDDELECLTAIRQIQTIVEGF